MKQKDATFRNLPWRHWQLLGEAGLFLVAAWAAIALLPFARVARLASGKNARLIPPRDTPTIDELRWAIGAVARRVPFRAKCFEQGLTAQWMLRRRRIASTLFYGVAVGQGGALSAHVWVRAGEFDVVGCESRDCFAVVAQFPPEPADSSCQSSRPASIR
ncbi:lasso peptide biosynthesis B2 protein [Sphingomonas psychrotolerans]|uniref:Lasso peptide biosynthesis B2 protein n=1 Tax=Sphingomonas psychrotolerans TaxID=1327635 RepID=A0ABU3N5K3_9SPHN|nr:lasso peptide biosynthesis B2 protein [Sphingomonas psychrotolerans]MDT8759753.1 lasso peptide biosynthesis B2 protein [Sphingomonas psychrotolerans]